ncbi:MAG: efflux RND transporter periplasmic adaptor subunit [Planctomycetes bacterium]|nr:efflux RND transporter periplasmic adaptor subunit [Planctomycetota bacterium]
MTAVRSDVDLALLAREKQPLERPPRRRLGLWVALALLVGFGLLVASTLGDFWRGATTVTLVRPKPATSSGANSSPTTVALQAAGWIEPDPFPHFATALVPGVVAEVLVREAQHVAAGEPLVRLVDDEARLARDAAAATLALKEAELARATQEEHVNTATATFAIREASAVAAEELAGKSAAAEKLAAAAKRAGAEVTVAEEALAVEEELARANASGPRQLSLARARLEAARAAVEVADAEARAAAAEAKTAAARERRATEDAQLRFDDPVWLESARAPIAVARADVAAAKVELARAELALARTVIPAPTNGVVLERLVAPGAVLEGERANVVALYDPGSVRVRVDVPQGDVAKVAVGQRAEILAESRSGRPYAGEVLRIVHRADIQKVTLQVHVRVLEPDELLRPEMLCQVRFFGTSGSAESSATAAGDTNGSAANGERVLVPKRLVENGSIWVVDAASGHATKRSIELGGEAGEWVEVLRGLNLSDKLIDEGRGTLVEGARLAVQER